VAVGVLAALVVTTVVSVDRVVGLPEAAHWVASQWRLDVGAPRARWALPPDPPGATRLAAVGDVGTGEAAERATAAAVDALEPGGELAGLLLLGDNVYPDGDPAEVGAKVLDPFAAVLDGPTRLVAALGNHDVSTDGGAAELAALGQPGPWFSTVLGRVEVVVVDSNRAGDPAQLAWLEATLARPRPPAAGWRVVIQHHPPVSAGYHGSHDPSVESLVPLYERYGVDLVLSGHDHDYQRSLPLHGVTYVVSGAAARLRPTARGGRTAMAASTYHFLELVAGPRTLTVRAIDQAGQVFDEVVLPTRPGPG